jgi:hypothetical protein
MHISRREFIVVSATGAVSLASTACNGGDGGSTTGPAGPTTLSVLVSGLVGTVSNNAATHLMLLDGVKTQVGPHAARLSVPAASVAPGSFPPSETKDGRSFWNLADYQLTLVSGDQNGPKRVTGLRRPGEEHKPTDVYSHKDVTWMAQMSKIPDVVSGRIKTECLAPDPRPAKVASRVRFNGGEVTARFRQPFHQVIFEFGPQGSPTLFKQTLAELSLSQTIPPGQVTFRLAKFDDPASTQDIVLVPSSGGDLEVVVENKPSPEHKCTSHQETSTLTHFAAFYQLLEQEPATKHIPTCRETNCPQCPSQTEVVYCPPADYDHP